MDQSPDEKSLLEALRKSLAGRIRRPDNEPASRPAEDSPPEFAILESCNHYSIPLDSKRTWSDWLRVIYRRILRKLLAGILHSQTQHNRAVSRLLRALWSRMVVWQDQAGVAADQLDHLRWTVRKNAEELQQLQLETRELRRELETLRQASARPAEPG